MADDNVEVDIPAVHVLDTPGDGMVTVLMPRDLIVTLADELWRRDRPVHDAGLADAPRDA